jgi:hypothetical protein
MRRAAHSYGTWRSWWEVQRSSNHFLRFMSIFLSYFSFNPSLSSIDWATWLYALGMPPDKPDFNISLAVMYTELADKWIAGEILEDREEFKQFSARQQLEFWEFCWNLIILSMTIWRKWKNCMASVREEVKVMLRTS